MTGVDTVNVGISTSVIQRGRSGISQYLFQLCRALISQNSHQYTLFVLEDDMELFRFAEQRMQIIPVPERFRPPLKDILWHQTVLPGIARRMRLDVLHVPSYRRMLWRKPCPLVVTIHDLAPFHIPQKYNWSRMFYCRSVVPRLARRQDQIVTISHTTAEDVTRFLRPASERLEVIHNGIDHNRFFPGDVNHARARCRARFSLDKPFFLYVARLEHPAKNHARLIAAFNHFKAASQSDWQLALAGGDWHGAPHIHQTAKSSPFSPDIRSLGFVPDDFLPDLYRAAEVFVYPSLFEGFGLPPLEAMASGCPVISSARGSLGEVLGNAAIRIDPENVDALAAKLSALSASTSERNRLRAAGFKQAALFDWSRTARAMVKVYNRAASRI